MGLISTVTNFLTSHQGVIATVLSVLFAVAKFFSTAKAPAIVAKIQGAFDYAAKLCSEVGSLFQKGADLLANLIKSDGVLGTK